MYRFSLAVLLRACDGLVRRLSGTMKGGALLMVWWVALFVTVLLASGVAGKVLQVLSCCEEDVYESCIDWSTELADDCLARLVVSVAHDLAAACAASFLGGVRVL